MRDYVRILGSLILIGITASCGNSDSGAHSSVQGGSGGTGGATNTNGGKTALAQLGGASGARTSGGSANSATGGRAASSSESHAGSSMITGGAGPTSVGGTAAVSSNGGSAGLSSLIGLSNDGSDAIAAGVDLDKVELAQAGRFGVFTDDRDGSTYHWTEIGTQVWMADNLNYLDSKDPGVCYEFYAGNCAYFGRMYNWTQAIRGGSSSDANPSGMPGVCPSHWHLPSNVEFEILFRASGVPQSDFPKLHDFENLYAGPFLAQSPIDYNNKNALDTYHFRLIPVGWTMGWTPSLSTYPWLFFGSGVSLWSSTALPNGNARAWQFDMIQSNYAHLGWVDNSTKNPTYVRCVYDGRADELTTAPIPANDPLFSPFQPPEEGSAPCLRTPTADEFCDTRDGQIYGKAAVGAHVWMTNNLNYSAGDTVGMCPDGTQATCDQYGRFYRHHEAFVRPLGCDFAGCSVQFPATRGICPNGWHLPTAIEVGADITARGNATIVHDLLGNQGAGMYAKFVGYDSPEKWDHSTAEVHFWYRQTDEFAGASNYVVVGTGSSERVSTDQTRKYSALSVRCVMDDASK